MKKEIEINGLTKKQTADKFRMKENEKTMFEKYKLTSQETKVLVLTHDCETGIKNDNL